MFLHLNVCLNCVLMVYWILWNGIVFYILTVFLCKAELFEIELFQHLTMCYEKNYSFTSQWIVWNFFIQITEYDVKLPKKVWYALKQNNQRIYGIEDKWNIKLYKKI